MVGRLCFVVLTGQLLGLGRGSDACVCVIMCKEEEDVSIRYRGCIWLWLCECGWSRKKRHDGLGRAGGWRRRGRAVLFSSFPSLLVFQRSHTLTAHTHTHILSIHITTQSLYTPARLPALPLHPSSALRLASPPPSSAAAAASWPCPRTKPWTNGSKRTTPQAARWPAPSNADSRRC